MFVVTRHYCQRRDVVAQSRDIFILMLIMQYREVSLTSITCNSEAWNGIRTMKLSSIFIFFLYTIRAFLSSGELIAFNEFLGILFPS
jgi:hypothetical protein